MKRLEAPTRAQREERKWSREEQERKLKVSEQREDVEQTMNVE